MEQLSTIGMRGRQSGVALFIALIMLLVMAIGSVGLIRSMDTATLVAGNLAFKQAAVRMTDLGIEAAANALPTILGASAVTDPQGNALCSNAGCTVTAACADRSPNCNYYASTLTTDARGVPQLPLDPPAAAPVALDWDNIPVITAPAPLGGYSVRFVIDRLCAPMPPPPPALPDPPSTPYQVVNPFVECFNTPSATPRPQRAGAPTPTQQLLVHYRISVRVTGPKGTEAYTQAMLTL
ncbi:MAG: hypothetical protein IOMNBAOH_00257 [Rhodocyclaceae bacterium]|nr:hypothetical protein [Rhodocyclaceae bacterium]MCG3185746.1 hypothetical protein [Rhodocyclaceae bacterium]